MDGVKADHYKGRLTVAQALGTSDAGKSLTADQRKQLADSMKKAGITAENYDVWVGADSFPVRMDVAMDTSAGTMTVSEHLADFSAKTAEVQVPPADQSFTIQEMLKMAQQSGATS